MNASRNDILLPDPCGWQTRLTASMIAQYRASGSWRDKTIADRLDELCKARAEQKLVIESGGFHTAREVRRDALRLAGVLTARGLRAGDVVSFQLPNWYEAVLVDLACAYAGFVCNPIVPIYRGAEVDLIVRDSGSRILFIPERFRNFDYKAMADELRPRWDRLTNVIVVRPLSPAASSFEALMAEEPAELGGRPDPNHVKLIMYTSGTTSRAKGVIHTHNTIATEINNFIDWLKLDENDVILMPSPLAHITGYLYGIQLPITLGCPVVLMDMWDVIKAADIIETNQITFTIGATPFLQELSNLCKETQRRLPSLRYFPSGGAPVPPEIVLSADSAFERCVAFRVYGSTEAPTVTLGVPDRAERELRARTDGYIVGHEVRLVDENGVEVKRGQEGEITTRGPELTVGYMLNEQNNEAFDQDGFFRTGDLAVQTPEGCLTITGRKKDIIIRGGENLSPKEIEDVLYTHPAIREVAVVAMPHSRLGETCCAFVTLKTGTTFNVEAMQNILKSSGLAKQKFPERLEIVDNLPYTAAGKIRKNILRDQITEIIRRENARNQSAND
jgi:acyl-CoA synthetase (AMP-forming)/AMP-acid ligase II